MNFNFSIPLYESALDLSITGILLRLLCALIVGVVIGTEREYTHRPAGMRTHMLVSLGACVVMIIGQLIFQQYRTYGATPDPARMAAQVITGVGFLGAGTILKEGPTVKGLTTAASLWATACLGLAAGAGYYALAIAGMLFIFATLTIFEVFQDKLIKPRQISVELEVTTADISACLNAINKTADQIHATAENLQILPGENAHTYTLLFRAVFSGSRQEKRKQTLLEALAQAEGTIQVHTANEFAGKL